QLAARRRQRRLSVLELLRRLRQLLGGCSVLLAGLLVLLFGAADLAADATSLALDIVFRISAGRRGHDRGHEAPKCHCRDQCTGTAVHMFDLWGKRLRPARSPGEDSGGTNCRT